MVEIEIRVVLDFEIEFLIARLIPTKALTMRLLDAEGSQYKGDHT